MAARSSPTARVCLFVTSRPQSALFRRVRFSSPGQTRRRLMEKRSLPWNPHGKAHSEVEPHGKARSGPYHAARVRLFVTSWPQSAFFRRVRFFSPGQTSTHLTEKRILPRSPHGKAHSALEPSRKSAFRGEGLLTPRNTHPPHTWRETPDGLQQLVERRAV